VGEVGELRVGPVRGHGRDDTVVAVAYGELLREWRTRRHLSQLELSSSAGVSGRHLSFLETGRSRPSKEMVLHLAEHLDVPLRARNTLLVAAGHAPVFPETALAAPEMDAIRGALDQVLQGHEPYPAVVLNRRWEVVAANEGIAVLVEAVAPWLLEPPVNVLRATLHPDGLAPRIRNLGEWAAHLLGRLAREADATGDPYLRELHDELSSYPGVDAAAPADPGALVVPLKLRHGEGDLSLFSTVMTFGTALDVTVAELSLEAFFPADAGTATVLRGR
jgi:transcriptional regulator with XRE-family HTH domain